MNVRKTRSLTAFWYWLSRFWTDPDAKPELANYYRARQIDSLSRQLPLASSATVLIVILWKLLVAKFLPVLPLA